MSLVLVTILKSFKKHTVEFLYILCICISSIEWGEFLWSMDHRYFSNIIKVIIDIFDGQFNIDYVVQIIFLLAKLQLWESPRFCFVSPRQSWNISLKYFLTFTRINLIVSRVKNTISFSLDLLFTGIFYYKLV